VIVFRKEGVLNKNMPSFLQEVKRLPGVVNASNSGSDLIVNFSGTDGVSWTGKDINNKVQFKYLFVGYDFIETLGVNMKEGRSFAGAGLNTNGIIFNETAIKAMGLQDPVGKVVKQWGEDKTIVGVVKDFHFESLYEKVKPCFLILAPDAENVMVRIKGGTEQETINRLRQFYGEYNPGFPFEFRFLDQDYQKLYESETRVSVLSRYFAAIAVIISCLGLFGLAAFAAQKRQKEIVVRKIVGATTGSIAFLLSKDFLKLVLLAIVLALPLSWWVTHQWLDKFAYRVSIGIEVYIFAALLTIFITVLTMSFQTIKAALISPVKGLKAE
jgi:ABC-type antimicrobial peptide transport system permease subunit